MVHGADYPKKVALSGGKARERCSEAVRVVVRAVDRHKLHPATRSHERVREEGVFSGPGKCALELGGDES